MSRYFVIMIIGAVLVTPVCMAGSPGSTGAVFLKMPIGSRPIAMGENFIAVADDTNAIYWNPAGLVQLKNGELMFMHSTYVASIMYDYVAAGFPIGRYQAAGVAINLITMDEMDSYDAAGVKGEPFGVKMGTGYLTYSYKMTPRLYTGVTLKYIFQKVSGDSIGTYSSTTFAGDIGVLYRVWQRLSAAVVLQNLGLPAKFTGEKLEEGSGGDPLPLTAKLGVSYGIDQGVLTSDLTWPSDNKIVIGFGTEYWCRDLLAIRLGYKYQGAMDFNDLGTDLNGLSLGAGLHRKIGSADMGVDYAFSLKGVLGDLHRITLVVGF